VSYRTEGAREISAQVSGHQRPPVVPSSSVVSQGPAVLSRPHFKGITRSETYLIIYL